MRRATVSVTEASVLLGVGRTTAYRAVRNGEIPSVRLGHRIVVPTAALRRILTEGGARAVSGAPGQAATAEGVTREA